MHNRIILEIFEKYKCPGITVLLQSYRCVSNEQPCLKTTGLYDNLLLLSSLFHFFYFIFSAPNSFSLCFLISPSLVVVVVLSIAFIKSSRKAFVCMHACSVAQSCPTLCDPVDCSPPSSSVHGILQARILDWVVIPFSRGSSQPRD